jgi:hypothetical protein
MMLLQELCAERSGDDDFTFRPTLRPTLRTALGPATPLHPGDQTRPHGNLFRDDPLQLTSSVAPLGKHPQYRRQVPTLPRRRLRLDSSRRRLDHPHVSTVADQSPCASRQKDRSRNMASSAVRARSEVAAAASA